MSSLKSNLLVVVSAGGQTRNGRFRWLQECERHVKHRLPNYVLLAQTVSPESPTGRDRLFGNLLLLSGGSFSRHAVSRHAVERQALRAGRRLLNRSGYE
jgi:hypothetical protein